MAAGRASDVEDLWRRVGLEQLRGALGEVERLAQQFEETLRALPSCSECARARLLEEIRRAGGRLAGEAASLSALAESLREAVELAERTQRKLEGDAPQPCRCAEEPCRCHE